MTTSGNQPRPGAVKFDRIAQELRQSIEDGVYQPGDRLPGERELSEQHGVATMTIRNAIALLRNEGLVESRKGAGVFVRQSQPIRRHGIARLSRRQWGSGKSIQSADDSRPLATDQVSVREEAPMASIATMLGLSEGDLACVRDRRYLLDGRPVMIATSYLSLDLVADSPITQADTGPGGTYARLADLGYAPAHFVEEVRFATATPPQASRLDIQTGAPVIKLTRTAFSADGSAVEVNDMTLEAWSWVLEYAFDA